jgi:DNA-binding response OmpR family regulator
MVNPDPRPARLGRILVIDDDAALVELLTSALTDSGFDVVAAHHGGDGLMLADVQTPDLVLLDVRMPGMSGVEVLQQMRARWPWLPVIVVTGLADTTLARSLLDRGAFDYVAKPFDVDHLQRCVAAALTTVKPPSRSTAIA